MEICGLIGHPGTTRNTVSRASAARAGHAVVKLGRRAWHAIIAIGIWRRRRWQETNGAIDGLWCGLGLESKYDFRFSTELAFPHTLWLECDPSSLTISDQLSRITSQFLWRNNESEIVKK